MKYQILSENQPLEMTEVTEVVRIPSCLGKNLGTIENTQIQNIIFTDGILKKEDYATETPIEEYKIRDKRYNYHVDTLKTKNVYLEDYSYVVKYTVAREFTRVGNIGGWFNVIRDVNIYLKNPKDKEALKKAKKTIKMIQYRLSQVDYSSIFNMIMYRDSKEFQFEQARNNIYTLKRHKESTHKRNFN